LFSCRLQDWHNDRGIAMSLVSDAALDFSRCRFRPSIRARPLKRATAELETQIAKAMLRGEFNDGDTIFVDVENERPSSECRSNC